MVGCKDGLGLIERSSDIEPLARSVSDAGGVVLVPALAGLVLPIGTLLPVA